MAVIFAMLTFLAGCNPTASTSSSSAPTPSTTNSISIVSLSFSPSSTTISAETTVIWTNNDSITHTVTSTSGPASFDSGNLSPGTTYSFKFTTAGTYNYFCQIHPNMTATIIVN